MVAVARIAEVMGGAKVLRRRIATLADLDEAVTHGLPRAALDALVAQVANPQEGTRLKYRIVPKATYQRHERLNPAHSQKAERLARVYAIAEAVWGDPEEARRFMNARHPELGDRTPLEVAMTELGARQVEEVLERGLYGLPA